MVVQEKALIYRKFTLKYLGGKKKIKYMEFTGYHTGNFRLLMERGLCAILVILL